jgi:hypothetical protein
MDVLCVGHPLRAWIPGPADSLVRRNTTNPHATKMTVVKTVSTALIEPFFLNWLFQDLDVGRLPGRMTLVYGNARL